MLMEKSNALPMASLANAQKRSTIAGKHSGKRVLCENGHVLTAFNQLRTLALQGNYWAQLSINGIHGLAAGRLHQDNIFVRKDAPLANGRGRFFMILPGIRATFEDLANGTFMLVNLAVDGSYAELQEKAKKPGLYKVAPDAKSVDLKFNGNIEKQNQRIVVIADRSPSKPREVAEITIGYAKEYNSLAKAHIERRGMDLHYTPGKRGIVGLKATQDMLKESSDFTLAESATLLANTIYNARDVEDVVWVSSLGGSAIITKALEILTRTDSVKLNNHQLYLHHPTSNSRVAVDYAAKLGITATEEKSSAFSINELRGNHLSNLFSKKSLKAFGLNGLDVAGATTSIAGFAIDPSIGIAIGVASGAAYFVRNAIAIEKNSVPSKY